MLELSDLRVSYGRIEALRGISLTAAAGQVTCLVGPNGAGKSSAMLAVAGALRQVSGSIRFEGEGILGLRADLVARRGLSLVPEGRGVFSTLSVTENLGLGGCARARSSTMPSPRRLRSFPRWRPALPHRQAGFRGASNNSWSSPAPC